MLRFGFELEGFYHAGTENITVPPKEYPRDSFPGLVEIRTSGGKSLELSYMELLYKASQYISTTSFSKVSHVFSGNELRQIRQVHFEKGGLKIENIYGKPPRLLGNKILASLQINISDLHTDSYRDCRGTLTPASYGLFDFVSIIRNLDEEFKQEIKESNRQPGFYCIKDGYRLEYRSLPNSVFSPDITSGNEFLDRVRKCYK
jgi:hypothetical protein